MKERAGQGSHRRKTGRGFVAVSTTMLAVSTAIAALTLWPVYQDISFIIVVAVTFAAASLIAILGSVFRWNSAVMLVSIVGTYFLIGVPLAVPGNTIVGVVPSFDGLKALLLGAGTS